MPVFFTADTHFGHGGARALYRRPFATTAEADRAMVERWNAVVGPDDEVWHLGDVAVGPKPEAVISIVSALAGRKHLVRGNNDSDAVCALPVWASVQEFVRITVEGVALTLCHYALRSWADQARGAVNLHGHSHGRLKPMTRQFDVGVDAREFRPVRLKEVGALPRTPPRGSLPLDPQT